MAESQDTIAERHRALKIVVKVMFHPTDGNLNAALRAIVDGTAAKDFVVPEPVTDGTTEPTASDIATKPDQNEQPAEA